MLKKIMTVLVAAALLASMTITAFADPSDTSSPAATSSAAVSPDPAATAAPGDGGVNAFILKVKEMTAQAKAIRTLLQQEKKLDQKLQPKIRSLKGVGAPDPDQIKAYEAELKPLTAQLKDLTQQLKKEDQKKDKHRDQAKIDELKAAIKDVETKIAAVKEKYKDLISQIDKKNSYRSNLKELRQKLQPMYAGLKPLINDARNLDKQVDKLIVSLKEALKVNDAAKATELINEILAKMDLLKANIEKRVALRNDIQKVLDAYK